MTRLFAARLNAISSLTVKEAGDGELLQPNCAYVAPGGKQLTVRRRAGSCVIEVRDGDFVSGHKAFGRRDDVQPRGGLR